MQMDVHLLNNIFYGNWQSVARTAIITVLAYIIMVLMLRVSGKRTLAKMNAFDFIVTIALGSSLATVALSKDVVLADGVLVFILLIGMQYILTWLSVRNHAVKNLVTSQPTLLLYKGEVLHKMMKQERVTIDEINVAVRKKGISDLKDVDAIVLETTGDLTIIQNMKLTEAQSLQGVSNYPSPRE